MQQHIHFRTVMAMALLLYLAGLAMACVAARNMRPHIAVVPIIGTSPKRAQTPASQATDSSPGVKRAQRAMRSNGVLTALAVISASTGLMLARALLDSIRLRRIGIATAVLGMLVLAVIPPLLVLHDKQYTYFYAGACAFVLIGVIRTGWTLAP